MEQTCFKFKIVFVLLLIGLVKIDLQANENLIACSSFIDTSYIELTKTNCDTDTELCLNIPFGDFLSYTVTDNGQSYLGGVNACDFDTSFAYTYFMLPGAGLAGPYSIDLWSVDGNNFTGIVSSMSALVDSMNAWNPEGVWMLDSPTSSIRGGTTAAIYGNMEVTQISSSISSTINVTTSLNPNGSLITLDTGYHELIFTEPVDGCLDTVTILINCSGCPEVYSGNTNLMAINCSSDTPVCFEIPINKIADYTITNNGTLFNGTIQECAFDSSFSYDYSGVPAQGASGPYQLQNWMVNGSVFIGVFANMSELVAAMNSWDPGGNWTLNTLNFTITGGNGGNIYSDIEVLQITSGISGTAVLNAFPSLNSVELWLPTGNHELLFVNNQNLCRDTVALFIDCVPCPDLFGGISLSLEAIHCDSATMVCLPIPFSEIDNYSVEINGIEYIDTFQSCGLDSSLIFLDTGANHVVFTHQMTGCKDSLEAMVACATSENLDLSISVNEIDTICIDTFELMGEMVSIENSCENASGEFVLVDLDEDGFCVYLTGIEPGTENACIVICDEFGYCDSTFFTISVLENEILPLDAINDQRSTLANTPILIDVLANDELNGGIDTLFIQSMPSNGTAFLDTDNVITYVPNEDYCQSNLPDEMVYVICNDNGCDSAIVYITVRCEALKVHNGFSPNNDGVNDYFVIKGAEDLPGNNLRVYNRWGLLVYHAENYQNDWQGTWEGNNLTAGTYFYLFDDGSGNRQSGYVQIHR